MDSEDLVKLIKDYYDARGLSWPTSTEAILFAMTELGEAIDLALMQPGNMWVRNNPDKEVFTYERFAEELGDTIMMLMVAGIVIGVNPLVELEDKILGKMEGRR